MRFARGVRGCPARAPRGDRSAAARFLDPIVPSFLNDKETILRATLAGVGMGQMSPALRAFIDAIRDPAAAKRLRAAGKPAV